MALQVTIVDGPSKWDLMVSLFHGDLGRRHHVRFHTLQSTFCDVVIDELQREDGSGERWNFKGRVLDSELLPKAPVSGFFSTRSRQGHFFVERPEPVKAPRPQLG